MNAEIHQLRPKAIATNFMCSSCGVDAGCNCGAPLMSKPQQVHEYDAANPGKSSRDVADALGVGKSTVHRAREAVVPSGTTDTVIGRNGKPYPARRPTRTEPSDDETVDAEHDEGLRVIAARGFLNRAIEAKNICTIGNLQPQDITDAVIKAADDAAAAWSTAARNLRGMIAHV